MSYDLDGNLTSDGLHAYSWNARGQLSAIDNGSTASFVYGPFGRRISKTVYGVNTGFLYDGFNVAQELSGSNPSANLLTGGLDEVFTRTDSTGVADFIRDGIGSTTALTDSTGAIQQTYTYDPFGATTTNGGSANSYQYIGREADATGLYYFRARYYDPAIDRFISEDPIGFAGGGPNLYQYAYDDPVNFLDPSGFKPKDPGPPCGGLGVNCPPPPQPPCSGSGGGCPPPPGPPAHNSLQRTPLICGGGTFGFAGAELDLIEGGVFSGFIHEQDSVNGSSTGMLQEAWVGGEGPVVGVGKITTPNQNSQLQGTLGFVGGGVNAGPLAGLQGGYAAGMGWGGLYVEGHYGMFAFGAGGYLDTSCQGGF